MSKSSQFICCTVTALIAGTLLHKPVAAQDLFTFLRPPMLSQPVPQARRGDPRTGINLILNAEASFLHSHLCVGE